MQLLTRIRRWQATSTGCVDGWSVPRLRDGVAALGCGLDPRLLRLEYLGERLLGTGSLGRAVSEVGDVGDPGLVFVAPEHVDVVFRHSSSSLRRSAWRS